MASTAAATNMFRRAVEAGGGGIGPVRGGTTTAGEGTYGEVAGRPRWLCICIRMA